MQLRVTFVRPQLANDFITRRRRNRLSRHGYPSAARSVSIGRLHFHSRQIGLAGVDVTVMLKTAFCPLINVPAHLRIGRDIDSRNILQHAHDGFASSETCVCVTGFRALTMRSRCPTRARTSVTIQAKAFDGCPFPIYRCAVAIGHVGRGNPIFVKSTLPVFSMVTVKTAVLPLATV